MAAQKPAEQSANEAKTAAMKARAETVKAKAEAAKARAEAAKARVSGFGGGHAEGFINFVREQGVIGLAVGLAVGAAAGSSVKAIVDNFINPIVGFILGGQDLSNIMWNTGLKNGEAELIFGWGAIISSMITLLATALVVYLVIHAAKLDRLDKKKG